RARTRLDPYTTLFRTRRSTSYRPSATAICSPSAAATTTAWRTRSSSARSTRLASTCRSTCSWASRRSTRCASPPSASSSTDREGHARAAARQVLGPGGAAVGGGDPLDQAEPEAERGPGGGPPRRGVALGGALAGRLFVARAAAVERLENARQVVLVEAGPAIVHLEHDRVLADRDAEPGGAAAVAAGVVEQVAERAPQQGRVPLERGVVVGDVEQVDRQAGALEGQRRQLAAGERPPVDRLEVEPRAGQELADQPIDLEHLALELGAQRRVAAALARAVEQDAHVAERGADLVGHRGEQLALVAHLPLDARRHVVDGLGQNAQLARLAAELEPALQLAVADVARDPHLLLQRAGEPPGARAGGHPQEH